MTKNVWQHNQTYKSQNNIETNEMDKARNPPHAPIRGWDDNQEASFQEPYLKDMETCQECHVKPRTKSLLNFDSHLAHMSGQTL